MSSKMRAGLIAGGFGAALDVARVLSPHLIGVLPDSLVSLLTVALALLEFFGLGIFAGVLAGIWLDLGDYGRQFTSGGFAGAIAALVVMVGDTAVGFILMLTPQEQTNTLETQSLFSRDPLAAQISLAIVVVITVLAALIYLVITLSISGLTAKAVASGKSIEALQAIIEAQDAQARPNVGQMGSPTNESGTVDPALLPYRRPEYSPFVDNNQQQQVISPWQRRRLEREGKLPPEDTSSGENGAPPVGQQGPVYRVYPPPKWRGPTPRR